MLSRNEGLFVPDEAAFARDRVKRLAALPPTEKVPCHGDYYLHNWLVDPTGTVRIIDFEMSRWDRAAYDFSRLYFRAWWGRPDLAAPFFEGYGRRLDEQEVEYVDQRMVVTALAEVALGRRLRDPQRIELGRGRLAELIAGNASTAL